MLEIKKQSEALNALPFRHRIAEGGEEDAEEDGGKEIGNKERDVARAEDGEGLVGESGKGGEATAETYNEEETQVIADQLTGNQGGEKTDEKTSAEIDPEGCPGKR